jgi:hypothetical protein
MPQLTRRSGRNWGLTGFNCCNLLIKYLEIFGCWNEQSLLAGSALLAAISLMPASATTYDYNVNLTLNATDSLNGSITTDCDNCTLGSSDFVAFNLNIVTGGSSSPFPTTTGGALIISSIPDNVTATPSGLFFYFSNANTRQFGNLILYDDLFGIGVFSALDLSITFCGGISICDVNASGPGISVPGVGFVAETGNFEFATSAVPEPSTWAMMILGFWARLYGVPAEAERTGA